MTAEHDALHRAICADPDDDLPRLALADWLDENGDPARAEFIRTQIDLARVPDHDPLWVKCRQFDPAAVTGFHMAHTLAAIALPPGFGWHSFEFRRGFPWAVGAWRADAFAGRAADLFAAAPVQCLNVTADPRPSLAGFAACPHLDRVVRLSFAFGHFGPADMARLGESPHAARLAELAFEQDGIDPDGLQALASSPLFPRLHALELRQNVIPPALLADALAAAPEACELRRLSLPYARVTRYDARHLFALPLLAGLESLDLSDNPDLGVEGARALAESPAFPRLTTLNLSRTLPGVPGVRALAERDGAAELRSLDLSANRLGPVAVRLLAASPLAVGLRVLRLGNNSVRDNGAEGLAESPRLAELLELDLSEAEVGDAGALALAESPHLTNLLRLDLRTHRLAPPLKPATLRALRARFGGRVRVSEAA